MMCLGRPRPYTLSTFGNPFYLKSMTFPSVSLVQYKMSLNEGLDSNVK
ncbi:MAG: hypothetical protein KZQ59_07025 [Candidatus Thiodiazotropha sp. (ex Lucinoma aequizonata)]|nr:hypothetical protein [Candidatus Thiodiazotropha sp. (ex Lucinoma aequizonata)]MCU7909299.1 hypothetical protein [Candidatus Thiodiazotropha sp. (ex Lucinoma aequizonata)]